MAAQNPRAAICRSEHKNVDFPGNSSTDSIFLHSIRINI